MHKTDSIIEGEDWIYYSVDRKNIQVNEISGCSRDPDVDDSFNQVRLTSGVVEIKYLDKWGGICDDGFTVREADVLCKQFGFDLGVANIGESSDVAYTRPIHLLDLSCNGLENDVSKHLLHYYKAVKN